MRSAIYFLRVRYIFQVVMGYRYLNGLWIVFWSEHKTGAITSVSLLEVVLVGLPECPVLIKMAGKEMEVECATARPGKMSP